MSKYLLLVLYIYHLPPKNNQVVIYSPSNLSNNWINIQQGKYGQGEIRAES